MLKFPIKRKLINRKVLINRPHFLVNLVNFFYKLTKLFGQFIKNFQFIVCAVCVSWCKALIRLIIPVFEA